jgi:hypothetical protein
VLRKLASPGSDHLGRNSVGLSFAFMPVGFMLSQVYKSRSSGGREPLLPLAATRLEPALTSDCTEDENEHHKRDKRERAFGPGV